MSFPQHSQNLKVLLSAIPPVIWMGVIFWFSSLHGSGYFGEPPLWYFIERKSAHVFEFAVLMLLAFRFFYQMFPTEGIRKILLIAGVFSLAYAMTDELHQFFVPFRGAKITDVFIDGMGILLMALVLAMLFQRHYNNKTLKKKLKK